MRARPPRQSLGRYVIDIDEAGQGAERFLAMKGFIELLLSLCENWSLARHGDCSTVDELNRAN